MTVTKCDICRKEVSREKGYFEVLSFGPRYAGSAACAACGKPIAAFLKRHGLMAARPEPSALGRLLGASGARKPRRAA